ncbi:hypothetical protein BDV95DRAFT_665071 [Massariosphaeria phaeospora]|uniref:Uncharacterized protein n=1 Tax=Massariosphaeria phaeospora TaxID=100035 RepID=A0A7C8MFE6_9PLEO|nr:hypothetical protein BDV95DRAFT_665071 [Massariosphaeria phaeospora]
MDSMRSLNTSLPKTRKSRSTVQPDINQTFRAAALTVTNLYKQAQADVDTARTEGYQDGLEALIAFLNKENLGVGDGEGWRIRQWATERLDGTASGQANSESDEEVLEDKRARSSSPIMERNTSCEETHSVDPLADSTHRSDSAPPPVQMEVSTTDDSPSSHQMFQFSGAHPYPIHGNSNDLAGLDTTTVARRAFTNPRRLSNRASVRTLQRSAVQNFVSLGNTGHKRKLMQDFFNVDSFNDRRDGSGGGPKRGRMS